MRRWMKQLAVCGVVGATLSVAFAAERLAERKSAKTKQSHRNPDFIGRHNSAAATPESELQTLVSDASSTPKRFTRSRDNDGESPKVTDSPARPNPLAQTSQLSDAKRSGVERAAGDRQSGSNPRQPEVVDASFRQAKGAKSKIQLMRDDTRSSIISASQESAVDELGGSHDEPPIRSKPSGSRSTTSIQTANLATRTVAHRGAEQGQSGTPSVVVEWVKRGEINVGQECACDLLVKNTGKVAARDVIVEAFFPPTVRLTNADPQPTEVENHLEWLIDHLPAGAEQTIAISMVPSQRGELATTANVRFTGTAASVFNVAEPLLKLSVNGPGEVAVGDPVVQTVTIANPGTGVAQNVKLQLTIPEGLEPTRGDSSRLEIGSLAPGESRTLRLSFTAISGGAQTLEIIATGDAELHQVEEATVAVTAPVLQAQIEGPDQRQVGREAKYSIQITNSGRAVTHNVRVTHHLPAGFKFVKADKNGSFDTANGTITWFVGAIEPSQQATLKFTAIGQDVGEFDHRTQVTSDSIVAASAEYVTAVEGAAELEVEIIDSDDPVVIGTDAVYEVRVSNIGSKAARKVGLNLELPRGLQVGEVKAPVEHFTKSGLILFNDLLELAPGKTALYQVQVKAKTEGTLRVRARLTSESVDDEVVAEETTKFESE